MRVNQRCAPIQELTKDYNSYRVIGIQLGLKLGHDVSAQIQIANVSREPGI